MGWIVYYGFLFIVFWGSYLVPGSEHGHVSPDVIKAITASVTLLTALGQAVARANLRFYLLCQRIWIWWNSDTTTLWRFGLRLDARSSQVSNFG